MKKVEKELIAFALWLNENKTHGSPITLGDIKGYLQKETIAQYRNLAWSILVYTQKSEYVLRKE